MFSKNKISDTAPSSDPAKPASPAQPTMRSAAATPSSQSESKGQAFPAKPKPSPSLLSNDLVVKGNVITTGDIQIEGTIEGDVRAHLLTVGESATVRGEVVADDVVVNGRVVGRVRGLKVRLTSTARVEGDIVHKTIAIESGAHFEGSVQRQEDPLGEGREASESGSAVSVPAAAPSAGYGSSGTV